MARAFRWIALGVGLIMLGAGISAMALYRAVTTLPPAYEEALRVEPHRLEEQGQELESQLAALYSDAQKREQWETVVTDQQLNGWLATKAIEDFPELAKKGMMEPRVLIDQQGVTLAFGVRQATICPVVSIRFNPFVTDDGQLAVEIIDARLGSVPVPTGRIANLMRKTFSSANSPLKWVQSGGNDVMLVDLERIASGQDSRRLLTGLECRQGEMYLRGETEEIEPLAVHDSTVGIP